VSASPTNTIKDKNLWKTTIFFIQKIYISYAVLVCICLFISFVFFTIFNNFLMQSGFFFLNKVIDFVLIVYIYFE
jgi:hypothetical protein